MLQKYLTQNEIYSSHKGSLIQNKMYSSHKCFFIQKEIYSSQKYFSYRMKYIYLMNDIFIQNEIFRHLIGKIFHQYFCHYFLDMDEQKHQCRNR